MSAKYHYFYKITNNINNHFYYGVHATNNLNDGYMGSGKRLHYAYKKYGMENFTKEILKFFDTTADAYKYEAEVVNEQLIKNPDCYNIKCGGEGWNTFGSICAIDTRTGERIRCLTSDPLYISGVYIPHCKNLYTYYDNEGNTYRLNTNDPKIKELNLHGSGIGMVTVKDKNGHTFAVDKNDPRYISGELISIAKNKVTVKDKKGNYYSVSVDDQRYLSGELVPTWVGKKHKKETIEKVKQTFKNIKHQQGEKNSQYGTCWIYKYDENNKPINIKIKKEKLNEYLNDGWIKGRKQKID